MKANKIIPLDFIIDNLTNSIRNIISGDSFETEVLPLAKIDLKDIIKKNGWNFVWKTEYSNDQKEVLKLVVKKNPNIIQGLISISLEFDHVYMHLLENAPFNIGLNKIYEGVAGNLVAYACKVSFENGFDGFVAFTSKTKLIEHYQKSLGAYTLGGPRMIIPTEAAQLLVDKYFK